MKVKVKHHNVEDLHLNKINRKTLKWTGDLHHFSNQNKVIYDKTPWKKQQNKLMTQLYFFSNRAFWQAIAGSGT